MIAAKTPPGFKFKISGLQKPEKINVENRLKELYTQTKKQTISKEELTTQIQKALLPYGYFKPQILIVLPTPKKPGKIDIKPGPRMRISQFNLQISGSGRENHEVAFTAHNLPINAGAVFNSILYEESKNKLVNAAENQGYLNSTFEQATVYIDTKSNQAKILLHFDTGERSYFGNIYFATGDPKPTPPVKDMPKFPRLAKIMQILEPNGYNNGLFTSKKIILTNRLLSRYIPFTYGCPFSNDAIIKLDSNLQSSGYFKEVNVTPAKEDSGSVPINVYLEPVERFRYTISGGYGTDTGVRGRLGLHVIPVNKYGHKLDFIGQGSSYQNAAQMKYTIPGRDPIHDEFNINGGFNNLNYVAGNSRSGRLSLVQQHITPTFQRLLSLNILQENFHYARYTPNESTVLYPKLTVTWRRVSNPVFSPSGFNITLNGLAASRAVLSKLNLSEFMLDLKGAITLDRIRTRFYGHIIQGFTITNNIYDVPLSIAQLLGGPENMRGFSFSSIGPGKVLSYGGIEIQKETIDSWYVTGFIDLGTVHNPEPKNTQYDLGVGLMWRSPVGIIKAAIAHPTNSNLSLRKDNGIRFVINMGPDI